MNGGRREDLQLSDAYYRALVENIPAIVYIDSNEASPRSLYVSPNVERILGWTAEEYIADYELWPATIHPDDRDRVLNAWSHAVESGEGFHLEYRFVRPDGTTVWVRDSSHLTTGPDGTSIWQGVLLDLSPQRRAEQELRTSEERYRALVENIPAVIYEMDPDDERRTIYVSAHVERVLGYSQAEWLDQPDIWIELLHPDDREIELAAHDRHSQTGEPWSREYRMIAADGREVCVRDQAMLLRDVHGRPSRWQGVMLDITAEKEAEEQLREARDELEFRVVERTMALADTNELMGLEIAERRSVEERYRRLIEHLPAIVYIVDCDPGPSGPDHYTSPQIETLLGYPASEWTGSDLRIERLHPHDRDGVEARFEMAVRTGEPFAMEYRYLHRDGHIVWVMDRASLLSRNDSGDSKLLQGVMVDVSARKEAEAKAADAERRFRTLAEQGSAVPFLYGYEPDGSIRVDYLGPQIESILGIPLDALVATFSEWPEYVHPDDREWVGEAVRRTRARGEAWSYEYRMIGADGRIHWIHSEGRPTAADEGGRPTAFLGMLQDVTRERETERERSAAALALRSLLEGMPAIPWSSSVDEAGRSRMLYVGPQVLEVLGYTAEELVAEPEHFERMLHPDDRGRVLALDRETNIHGDRWEDEYRVIRRDGEIRWLHAVGRVVSPPGIWPRLWQGVSLDVTPARPPAAPTVQIPDAPASA